MPVENPDYKPDWEALYDQHKADSDRLGEELQALTERDNALHRDGQHYDSDERTSIFEEQEKLRTAIDGHDEQCRRCIDTFQHETIQDAAAYIFRSFDTNEVGSGVTVGHQIDFEQFTTMEEVTAAWVEARDATKQIVAEETRALPSGRPDGLDIFEETGSNQITSARHLFDHDELGSSKGDLHRNMVGGCDVLVTVDQRDGEYHVCFSQEAGLPENGYAVQHWIAELATAVYHRVRLVQEAKDRQPKLADGSDVSREAGDLSEIANEVADPNSRVRPDQFSFYIHHPPAHMQQEQFFRVDLNAGENGYERPQFLATQCTRYNVMPAAIQEAYRSTQYAQAEVANPKALPAPDHEG